MSDDKQFDSYYVKDSQPKKKIYVALLIVGIAAAISLTFFNTESSIDTISRKYPQQFELGSDNDAENTAYAMQSLFKETGLLLNDAASSLP